MPIKIIIVNLNINVLFILRVESAKEINKKNSQILNKLEDMSRVRRPNTISTDKLRNSMIINRSFSKK